MEEGRRRASEGVEGGGERGWGGMRGRGGGRAWAIWVRILRYWKAWERRLCGDFFGLAILGEKKKKKN